MAPLRTKIVGPGATSHAEIGAAAMDAEPNGLPATTAWCRARGRPFATGEGCEGTRQGYGTCISFVERMCIFSTKPYVWSLQDMYLFTTKHMYQFNSESCLARVPCRLGARLLTSTLRIEHLSRPRFFPTTT